MFAFCIDKHVIGTEQHLASDSKGFAWVDRLPPATWYLTGRPKLGSKRCLDTALALCGRSVVIEPPESHRNAVEPFGSLTSPVPWAWTMTPKAHKTFVKGLVKQVIDAMVGLDTSYYEGTWVLENSVFEAMQPAKLDVARWRALCEQPGANMGVLETLKPDRNGYCKKIVYDRLATRTGRLTVTSGPQALVLNRDHRDVFASEYGDEGAIVQLDFNALEIRGLYYECGNAEVDGDLYAALATSFHRPVERATVKEIVIPALYGQSPAALAVKLGLEFDELRAFMNSIRSQFKIDTLLQKLRYQNIELKGVKNHHGRLLQVPAMTDHILLNTFAQATGVDVSLLGFSSVVKSLPMSARPLFLIHDALVLDIKKADVKELDAVKHVKVQGFDQRFLLKVAAF